MQRVFRRAAGFVLGWMLVVPVVWGDETTAGNPATAETQTVPPSRLEFVFEPDAYYSDVALLIALSQDPIAQVGELSELQIYSTLLSRAAIFPQKMVVEASVNPMPLLGTLIKDRAPTPYRQMEFSNRFNLVKAVTAGFEEPYAFSVLAGNVVNFSFEGKSDLKGLGYSGYLVSAGNFHIKDNTLIRDDWVELEWKLKGDRKSPVKKLSWSFRVGAKIHFNPDIADIMYVSLRRSRVDYQFEELSLLRNTGFEYTLDLGIDDFSAMRHYLVIDRSWPLSEWQMAFTLAVGVVWQSSRKYSGSLADDGPQADFQYILRPNVVF